MPSTRSRLQNVRVDEVSFVDKGANPGAHVVLWKRRKNGPAPQGLFAKLWRRLFAKQMDEEPRSFEDVREDQRSWQVMDAIDDRIHALSASIFEIMRSEADDKEARILASLGEFGELMGADVPDLLAGRIAKRWSGEGAEGPSSAEEVHKHLVELLSKDTLGSEEDDVQKIAEIDVAKLSDEDRGRLEELAKKAARVDELEKAQADLTAKVEELEKKGKDPGEGDDESEAAVEKMLKALPDETRKIVEPMLKAERERTEKLSGEVTELKKAQRRGELRDIAKGFTALAKSEDEIVAMLEKADAAEMTDDLVATLKAADEAARRGLEQLGSDADLPGGGEADDKLDGIAKKLREADPQLTYEQAYAKACTDNPELYEEATSPPQ